MAGLAKFELETLSDLQKTIHTDEEKKGITSVFYSEIIKSMWHSHITIKMTCTVDDNEDEVVFNVNDKYHYLMYTYMNQDFPCLRVKPEFKDIIQICWPHNLGSNIIIDASFDYNEETIQSWDSCWADNYYQWFMSPGFREQHRLGIGNVPNMQEWTTVLPAYPTSVHQPWSYSKDTTLAFPIFLCPPKSKLVHRYRLRRKITDLLRMRKQDPITGKWTEIKCNLRYLDGAPPNGTLRMPELWGEYAYITPEEVSAYKDCKTQHVQYIDDIAACDGTNPVQYGSTAEISLIGDTPCKAIFWVAENVDSTLNRNYSNYSTNTDNLLEGYDPIKWMTLKYGSLERMKSMLSIHHSVASAKYHFPSPPDQVGYHAYSFAQNAYSINPEIGICFSNMQAKLLLSLYNYDPYANSPDLGEDKNDTTGLDEDSTPIRSREEAKTTGNGMASFGSKSDTSSSRRDEVPVSNNSGSKRFLPRVRLLLMKKISWLKDKTTGQWSVEI